ncbi:MAG: type II toxin-antitoxin system ParD family antitoxin [Pyrinomonadaceae bacterium]
MNVSLTPELERIVNLKVESGQYNSASEVMREGLRLLQQRDEAYEQKLAWLKGEIQIGIDDLEAGRFSDGSVAREVRRRRLLEMQEQNA